MAGSIQGLTIIINGDATPLTKAMRNARAEAGTLRGHLAAVNNLLKFNPTSGALITRQQQLLSASVLQTKARLDMLKASYAQLAPTVSTMTEAQLRQFMSLQREITQTELRMAELRQEAIRTGAAGSVAAHQWAGRFTTLQAGLRSVSTQLMAVSAMTALVTAAAITASYKFESSFAGVRKTIIATDEEYEKLAQSARNLALVKPVDVNDINRIMELGGQLNIARQYLEKFAGVMADLDVSTDMGIEEGSLQLAQFMNIANMAQSDVDRLGATIVDLGNNSATTEARMMNMAMRIVGAGRNIGMSAQDVLGLASSLSAVGIQAEMGGNAISTVMNRIDKDVALGRSTLQTWAETAGMSASEFKTAWETDVTSTFLRVIQGMGDFRDEGNNLNVLLKDMGINYMRQIDTMQRLSRAGDLTTSLIARANVAWESNTALVREATQRYSTAESKVQMMKNSVNEMGIAIGNELLPELRGAVDWATACVHAFSNMDEGTRQLIVGALLFTTVLGPLTKGVQLLSGVVGGGIKLFMSLKTALELAAGGQLTFMNMTIATNAATAQAAAAKAADMAASAALKREYATLAASSAAVAAAMGNETLAAQLSAIAKSTDALATEAEAAAEEQSAVASIANAGSKGILASATAILTAQTWALSVALGVTNGMLLGYVAVLGALLIATGAVISKIAEAHDPMNQLTVASQEQADKVERLKGEYESLAASEGASAEAVWAAKAAYEEERDALEATSITVGEFCENVEKAAEDQRKLAQDSRDAISEAQSQAGAIINLCDEIESLSATADGNTDDMQRMNAQIAALNMQVPGLSLHYDEATKSLVSNAGAWREVAEAEARAQVQDEALGAYNDALAARETLTKNLAVAQEEYNRAAADPNNHALGKDADRESASLRRLREALDSAQDAYDRNEAEIRAYIEAITDAATKESSLNAALAKVASGEMSMYEAVKYVNDVYGQNITLGDLIAEKMARVAQETGGATVSLDEYVEAIDEARDKNELFDEVLVRAGVSTAGLAGQLYELGYSADDVASSIEDVYKKTADGLNKIEVDSEMTLNKLFENLEHNREVTANWASNLDALYDLAGEDYKAYIDYLRSLGPEYATVVQNALDEAQNDMSAFVDHAHRYQEILDDDAQSAIRQLGIVSDAFSTTSGEVDEAVAKAADDVSATVNSKVGTISAVLGRAAQDAGEKGEAASSAYADAIKAGKSPEEAQTIARNVLAYLNIAGDAGEISQQAARVYASAIAEGKAPEEARIIANAVKLGIDPGDLSWIGKNAVDSVRQGMEDGKSALVAVADEIAATIEKVSAARLEINSPSKVMRRIGRGVDEGLVAGMLDDLSDIERASGLIAAAAAGGTSADWQAATRQPAAAARSGRGGSAAYPGARRGDTTTITQEFNVTTNDPEQFTQVAMSKLYHASLG